MKLAQNWRMNKQRYALTGVRCDNCQQVTFPPRAICPECAARAAEAEKVREFPKVEIRELAQLERASR